MGVEGLRSERRVYGMIVAELMPRVFLVCCSDPGRRGKPSTLLALSLQEKNPPAAPKRHSHPRFLHGGIKRHETKRR